MFAKGLRKFLYAGALLALAPFMARADADAPTAAPAAAPATQTVRVIEYQQEWVEETRTVYRPVQREVVYTVNQMETVVTPVQKTITCYEKKCETVMETRCVTKRIPCWEEKTEMVTRWKCEKVTEMVTKTVRGGHWECCEVPAGGGFLSRLSCKCPDPCATKTVKKWVSECHTECVPVCRTKLVKVCEPCTKKVCTYKCVTEQVQCPVTRTTCVPVQKTITVNECHKVCKPVQCTKIVCECQPVCEKVKVCKMVPKCVEKQVACAPACQPTCCQPTCCQPSCKRSFFSGLFNRCCKTSCGAVCGGAAACCN